ncbi:UDP-3-O-(3-hydroxymyristoyl)glucosamine N-acyltransferase [Candidatus Lariskella endosymbiont of Epinotia ramella]|uniref:UDP-3-O-(3-hydroxymyristoyl)glucosamine N-acyltransferase n=1 Tax=Candidatus Lariskella endosymbiont of Epinotia ramella TaxID=3066224 RepID=UPI0030CA7186
MGVYDSFWHSRRTSVKEIASVSDCKIVGSSNSIVEGVATLKNAAKSDISFFNNPKYLEDFKNTSAGACIIKESDMEFAPKGLTCLVTKNPYVAWAKALDFIYLDKEEKRSISSDAYIDGTAKIGKNCLIEPGVFIGSRTIIGDNCIIRGNSYIGEAVVIGSNVVINPNVTILFAEIGERCILHSGVRIGHEGFGFANDGVEIIKVKQLGRVIIGKNVEIGANSCIDRGAIEDTVIGDNTKLSNMVQIAHNVSVGSSCFFAGQVGIAGSTTIGNFVMLGGQVGIAGHLNIADNVSVAAQSGVMTDIPKNQKFGGCPAVPMMQWHRQTITLKKLTSK